MNAKPLSDFSAIEEAKRLVDELLRLESRGVGDRENAMRRLANRYGLPWRTFWNIKYRNRKDVFVGVLRKLREAHRAECRRELNRMAHEMEIAKINGVYVDDLQHQLSALADRLQACVAQDDGEAA
jgi:hypothetical protein